MSKFSDEEVLKVSAKLDSNSFRQGEYCRALFGVASMLNHSCVPNARVVFDAAGNVKVFSKCDIEAGEEITITYVSQLLGSWVRAWSTNYCFKKMYHFNIQTYIMK